MKNITAIFFTTFFISGIIGTLILFLMKIPTEQAIFSGIFGGLGAGTALAIIARKNQRTLKA